MCIFSYRKSDIRDRISVSEDMMANLGFFRVTAISTEVQPGNIEACLEEAKKAVDSAVNNGSSLLLLQELCLTSVSCGDMLFNGRFIRKAESAAEELTEYTAGKDIIVCFSLPILVDETICKTAVLAVNGEMIGAVPLDHFETRSVASLGIKQCMPDIVEICGKTVPFGKDILFQENSNSLLSLRISSDRDINVCADAAVALYPTALMATVTSEKTVHDALRSTSDVHDNISVFCSAGAGESTSSGVYSGITMITEDGAILSGSPQFGNGVSEADVDLEAIAYRRRKKGTPDPCSHSRIICFDLREREHESIKREPVRYPFLSQEEPDRWRTAMEIQSRGLATRLAKTGIDKAVIGVSGGLDSTLALLVSVKAMEILGKTAKDVIAVSMPCFGTSVRTKTNADRICEALDVDYRIIDISESVSRHLRDIGHDAETADTAYENAQARERTQVLMDLANMENGLVVGTGDMSEAALGWCTFNGDHMSMYNVNCSVTKTFIRNIVSNYANECDGELSEALKDIVDTPVSPELKPAVEGEIAQKTEDIIGPYDAHDFFLYHFIRNGSGPEKILKLAESAFSDVYTHDQLDGWLKVFFKRFFSSQFKRNCAPDGPNLGHISLSYGSGWSIPSDVSGKSIISW